MSARSRSAPALALSLAATALLLIPTGSEAETDQRANLRVGFKARIAPKKLPRQGAAPIRATLGGQITTLDGSPPPPLQEIEIALNRAARLDPKALGSCRYEQIQPASTAAALRACGQAKVGEGSFAAAVAIPEQSPFPSEGEITAYNGTEGGRPVIFAHVYGTQPVPASFTLPLRVSRANGRFATVLSGSLPEVASSVAYVTGISLTLGPGFTSGAQERGYLSAGCPAPEGFPGAVFALARVGFSFATGETLGSTLVRSCRVR